jgi:hypothetical protein
MFNEIFDLSWWCVQFATSFFGWWWIYSRLQPAYLQIDEEETNKTLKQLPTRILTFLHAILCSIVLGAYIMSLININGLYMARAISSAYLVFELMQTWNATDPHVNPFMQAAHHIITLCILYGLFGLFIVDRPTYGILLYYMGEPPVAFLQMTWYYLHADGSHKRECAVSGLLTIQSYLICRVLCFGYALFCMFLPSCSLFNPFTWISFAMAFAVYALNVLWFLDLVRKNQEFMPESMLKTPIWATLVQYSARLP